MLEVSKVSSIDNSNVESASTPRADSEQNFQDKLAAAQKEINEKYKNQALIPWGSVENIFQSLTTGFDTQINLKPTTSTQLDNNDKSNQLITAVHSQNNDQPNDQQTASNLDYEESGKASQNTLEQTVIQVNLAGNPFFLDALWGTAFAKMVASRIDLDQIISKIVEQAKLLKTGDRKTLEVVLSPQELGKIVLAVTKNEGTINIQIFAAENAKELLEENLSLLETSLKNANINIGSLAVSIRQRKHEESSAKGEETNELDVAFAPLASASSPVNIAVDTALVKKLLGWLPTLNVDSKV